MNFDAKILKEKCYDILNQFNGYVLFLNNNIIEYVNEFTKETFQITDNEILGKDIGFLFGEEELYYYRSVLRNSNKQIDNGHEPLKMSYANITKFIEFDLFRINENEYLFVGNDVTQSIYDKRLIEASLLIADATFTSKNIYELYVVIHKAVNKIVDAKNFFIASYNKKKDIIEFPYFIDEKDENFIIIKASEANSLTANVINSGKPQLFTKKDIIEYFGGEDDGFGSVSEVWLGIPLIPSDEIIGAFAVQSYDNPKAYNEMDMQYLSKLSKQISIAISKKMQEEKLKLSEEKFRVAFYTSPDAIAINRLSDGMYVEINEGFTNITGFTPEDVKGKTSYDINIWTDFRDRDKLVQGLKEKGVYENLEAVFRMKDGTEKYAVMTAKIIMLNNEPHILSITRDIDEFKKTRKALEELNLQLEQRVAERTIQIKDAMEELQKEIIKREAIQRDLERYQKELAETLKIEQELGEMKSRFISMVSHEYRTPLTVVYTSSELLERYFKTGDYEKHTKHIDRIKTAVNNMIGLLEQVLFINKAEHNKILIKPEKFDLIEFIYIIIEEMKMLDTGNHIINLNTRDEKIIVETDKNLINQILNNLISNAIKYSKPETEIDIDVFDNSDFVNINVSDNGIGINPEEMNNIYDYFYRGSNVGNIPGTGLGLAIVKKSVDTLNGFIYFTSEVNIGTSFSVKIPKRHNAKQ